MKGKSWAGVKTLILILSINLFVCTDIVECTEYVSKCINRLSNKEIFPIIYPGSRIDGFKGGNSKFGEFANFEKDKEHFELFMQNCGKDIVLLEIEFEMDKAWEQNKFFEKLQNTDEFISFKLKDFREVSRVFYTLSPEELTEGHFKNVMSILYKLSTNKEQQVDKSSNNLLKEDETKKNDEGAKEEGRVKSCYYVLTSLNQIEKIISNIEKDIVDTNFENYISYNISFLYLATNILNIDILSDAYDMKELKFNNVSAEIQVEGEKFLKNCHKLRRIYYGKNISFPYNLQDCLPSHRVYLPNAEIEENPGTEMNEIKLKSKFLLALESEDVII